MKNEGNKVIVIMVVLLALVGLLVADHFNVLPGRASVGGEDGTTGGADISIETLPEDVTLTYNDKDMEDLSNDPASNLKIYSPDLGNVADDGTVTLSPKEAFKAIAGFNSTTYYGKAVEDNAGTADQNRFDVELARAGTLTVSAFNSDDDQPNSVSDAQEIGASDEDVEMEICLDTTSNNYWGEPSGKGDNVVVIEYNKTVLNGVSVVGGSRADAPSDFSRNANATKEEAWTVPGVVDGDKVCFILNIDATSTETSGAHPLELTFYDANVDLREDNYEVIYDIEDEDNNLLSLKETSKIITLS